LKTFIKITALFCIIALLSGCGGLIGDSDKALEEKAVVTVNGEHLSLERFNYYFYNQQDEMLQSAGVENSTDIKNFWKQKTDGVSNLEIAKESALAAMIDDILKYQKAIEEGIKLTADEENRISSTVGQMKQNEETMKQLEQVGIDADTYEQLVIESMYIQKLVLKYVDDGKIKIDEELIRKELEDNYVKAQHILFMTQSDVTGAPLSEEKIAEKRALAEDVLKRINAGEDFDKLMNEYCEDPGVKGAPDGYVFTEGQMVAEFEEAAYALGVNQVSGIVETSYGYHIIKRVPFDLKGEQEKECMAEYQLEYGMPKISELTKKWKAEAKIEINDKVYDKIEPTIVSNTK